MTEQDGQAIAKVIDFGVAKAISAKDRNRRYDSPNRLAADIGCFLKNEAIRHGLLRPGTNCGRLTSETRHLP